MDFYIEKSTLQAFRTDRKAFKSLRLVSTFSSHLVLSENN